jgi:hypothetical protein
MSKKEKLKKLEINLSERGRISSARTDYSSTWTPAIEEFLRRLQNQARAYKLLHSSRAAHLARKGKIMKIINIISVATSGTTLLSNLEFDEKWVNVGTALQLYLTAILIGISEFMDWSAEADEHRTAETDFGDLVNLIERQLVLEPRYRQNARDFMSWVDHDFKMKFDKNPKVPNQTVKKLMKQFGSKLNPELIDVDRINQPPDGDSPDEEENEEDEVEPEVEPEEIDVENPPEPSPKQSKRRERKKPMSPASSVFVDDDANQKLADWETMRMLYELDRYQQS